MADEDSDSLFLQVDLGPAGELAFSTFDEFKRWFANEKSFFTRLANGNENVSRKAQNALANRWRPVDKQISLLEQQIQQGQKQADDGSTLSAQIQTAFQRGSQRQLNPSGSGQAEFLSALHESSALDAAVAICLILGEAPDPNHPSAYSGGAALAIFEGGHPIATKAHRKALDGTYRDGKKQVAILKGHQTRLKKISEDLENANTDLIATADEAHQALTSKHKKDLDERLEEARATLKKHEETYEEKIALHETVEYWEAERKQRSWDATRSAIAFAVSLLASALMLWWFATRLFAAEITPQKIGAIFLAATPIFWGLRVLARLLLSYLHLGSDASHRQLLIKTYLALHNEGKVQDEDRELLLGAIFRPASTGIVRDDAAPSWSEFISKLDGRGSQ